VAPIHGVGGRRRCSPNRFASATRTCARCIAELRHLNSELPDTDIFVGASLRPEQFAHARKLRWIHSTAAGVSQLMYPELRNSAVIITQYQRNLFGAMAEHTMGLILAAGSQLSGFGSLPGSGNLVAAGFMGQAAALSEINGSVLLIVGYGSIGRELAEARACVRRASVGSDAIRTWRYDARGKDSAIAQLNEALPHADYVVIAAPDTSETKHLIGAEQIAGMKRGARLINVSRGSLLDESALVDALKSGALGAAALDVAEVEPLPADSKLWNAPNLFITPHTSAISERLWQRETDLFLKLLEQWFSGKELSNRVDLSRGY